MDTSKSARRPRRRQPGTQFPPRSGDPSLSRPIGREWSREQADAIDQVGQWLKQGEPQVFRVFGYAGESAKRHLRATSPKARAVETAFAAFTGKAALVMRSKGCAGATTIHALIYRATEGAEGAPNFTLNADGPASKAGLIVIDECSMVEHGAGSRPPLVRQADPGPR